MDASRNGGAAVVSALADHGVSVVFGIPGTHNLELYRHLPAHGIRAITPRHEQGAGYAADGYSQVAGRPGVVITTSGPGTLNAATAAATAWAESRPLLIVSPGLPLGAEHGDAGELHETKDAVGAMQRIVAWARRVRSPEEAAAAVTDAFAFFASERPRPVYLEIPLDVLEAPWSGTASPASERSAGVSGGSHVSARSAAVPRVPAADAVDAAAALWAGAARPVIVAGGGARGAVAELRALAEAAGAPVLTTCNGKGTLPEAHPLSLGASVRLPAAHALLADADVALVVGSELGDSDLWGGSVDSDAVIRVDLDAGQLDKHRAARVGLHGDARATLAALLAAAAPDASPPAAASRSAAPPAAVGRAPWTDLDGVRARLRAEAEADGAPWVAINEALRAALPADAVLAGDSSQVTYLGSVHRFEVAAPARFLYMAGFATLGYGLPAAIGAKLAAPDTPVAALLGDGAFMFSVQELVTAVELRLPLPVVVVDSGGYGEIEAQQARRGIPPIGVDLLVPDLPALARACGAHGVEAANPGELGDLVRTALTADVPTLIRIAG